MRGSCCTCVDLRQARTLDLEDAMQPTACKASLGTVGFRRDKRLQLVSSSPVGKLLKPRRAIGMFTFRLRPASRDGTL